MTELLRKAENELIVHIDVGKKRVKDKPFTNYYWKDTPSFRRRKMRAWMVNVDLPEGTELSDNCFDMFPDDERQIKIRTSSRINLEDIKVSCMNQIVRRHKK